MCIYILSLRYETLLQEKEELEQAYETLQEEVEEHIREGGGGGERDGRDTKTLRKIIKNMEVQTVEYSNTHVYDLCIKNYIKHENSTHTCMYVYDTCISVLLLITSKIYI